MVPASHHGYSDMINPLDLVNPLLDNGPQPAESQDQQNTSHAGTFAGPVNNNHATSGSMRGSNPGQPNRPAINTNLGATAPDWDSILLTDSTQPQKQYTIEEQVQFLRE